MNADRTEQKKYSNALKILRDLCTFYATFRTKERVDALKVAISAIEKLVEKPVIEHPTIRKRECPVCGGKWNMNKTSDFKHCPFCGQKISYTKGNCMGISCNMCKFGTPSDTIPNNYKCTNKKKNRNYEIQPIENNCSAGIPKVKKCNTQRQ